MTFQEGDPRSKEPDIYNEEFWLHEPDSDDDFSDGEYSDTLSVALSIRIATIDLQEQQPHQ